MPMRPLITPPSRGASLREYVSRMSVVRSYSILLLMSSWLIFLTRAQAQQVDSAVSVDKGRVTGVSVAAATLYAASMAGLYNLWYADYPRSNFHFINDCDEWMGIDKLGHITSAYWIGRVGYESLRWAGLSEGKAIWYGGTWGWVYLTSVEIFDGFSAEWGASACDLASNTAGAFLFIGQQLGWHDQRILLKFSFHPTDYAQYRPDLLGETPIQRVFKDYNGQTYWLSLNLRSFLGKESKFPWWINLAFGYGANGMLGASENPAEIDGEPLPEYDRYPRYLFSLDIDMTRIPVKKPGMKILLDAIGVIKIPFPALEFNPNEKVRFHPIYF